MGMSQKLGLTALIAALLLASALGAASARNFQFSTERIRATWSRFEFGSEVFTLRCPATLEGGFLGRTIAKTQGSLIGFVTRADLKSESCIGGRATARALPWHLTYEGFTGTLPNATSVRLLLSRFLIELNLGFACTLGTATDNITFSAALNAAREILELTPVVGRNSAHALSGFCPREVRLTSGAGDGLVRALETTTRVTVTLI